MMLFDVRVCVIVLFCSGFMIAHPGRAQEVNTGDPVTWSIEEEEIPQLNQDGIGRTIENSDMLGVHWGGKKRDEIRRLLTQVRLRRLPESLYLLTLKLLESRGPSDANVGGDDILDARIKALLAAGEGEAILAMLESIPRAQYSSLLWDAYFNAQLLTRPLNEVCQFSGQVSYSYARNPAAQTTILACLESAYEDESRETLFARLPENSLKLEDYGHASDWQRFKRLNQVIDAWRAEKNFAVKDLSAVEYTLFTPKGDAYNPLLEGPTSPGLRRTFLTQGGSIAEAPPAVLDLILADGWIGFDQYLNVVRDQPGQSRWFKTLESALADTEAARRVRAVWNEKDDHITYRLWLSHLGNVASKPLWDLDENAYYLLDGRKDIENAILTIPQERAELWARLSIFSDMSEPVMKDWSTGSGMLDAAGRGQLNWSRLNEFSVFDTDDAIFTPSRIRDIYEAVARRDKTYVLLFVAAHSSWEDLAHIPETLLAICAHALYVLGFETESRDLIRNYITVHWIGS